MGGFCSTEFLSRRFENHVLFSYLSPTIRIYVDFVMYKSILDFDTNELLIEICNGLPFLGETGGYKTPEKDKNN